MGTKNPKFYNYFVETVDLYRSLISAESILNKTGCLNEYNSVYFNSMSAFIRIEDDHIPFLQRGKLLKIITPCLKNTIICIYIYIFLGIEVVHLIPNPFPKVWHKISDNKDALHMPTMLNLIKILQVFLVSYLEKQ